MSGRSKRWIIGALTLVTLAAGLIPFRVAAESGAKPETKVGLDLGLVGAYRNSDGRYGSDVRATAKAEVHVYGHRKAGGKLTAGGTVRYQNYLEDGKAYTNRTEIELPGFTPLAGEDNGFRVDLARLGARFSKRADIGSSELAADLSPLTVSLQKEIPLGRGSAEIAATVDILRFLGGRLEYGDGHSMTRPGVVNAPKASLKGSLKIQGWEFADAFSAETRTDVGESETRHLALLSNELSVTKRLDKNIGIKGAWTFESDRIGGWNSPLESRTVTRNIGTLGVTY